MGAQTEGLGFACPSHRVCLSILSCLCVHRAAQGYSVLPPDVSLSKAQPASKPAAFPWLPRSPEQPGQPRPSASQPAARSSPQPRCGTRQLFKPLSLLGGWRSFLVADPSCKPRSPAQPAAGAVSAPQKPVCTPKRGCDGSPSSDPALRELLPKGRSAAQHQGAAVKRERGWDSSLGRKEMRFLPVAVAGSLQPRTVFSDGRPQDPSLRGSRPFPCLAGREAPRVTPVLRWLWLPSLSGFSGSNVVLTKRDVETHEIKEV
ncbi:uncharacterized protein LOC121233724 [Aquila chrysaetos chrysaetos]|uniref:uncharacterized protein LOC121233724 n=1 Tax=Aquila chrysaetos chrysaetos TaxID=223781 RepID=UPI001B7D353E|nr:uncharacterized protein LOC121233724 [Aquila chrysaetos chrysaetos]